MSQSIKNKALVLGLTMTVTIVSGLRLDTQIIGNAEARVGRPMTPNSVAGVARRTTRRSVRRTSRYINTLPRGCSTVVVSGSSLYSCGGTYYQTDGNRYVVVVVD